MNVNMEVEEADYKLMSLKLLVDTKSNKVLFAEASKDFVDFLFHILSLPIGAIVRLVTTRVQEADMVGCLGDLYKSIESLSPDYLDPNVSKNNTSTKKLYACSSNCTSTCSSASNSSPSFSFPSGSGFFSKDPFSSPSDGFRTTPRFGSDFSSSLFGASASNSSVSGSSSKCCNYVSDVAGTVCPSCNRVMSHDMKYIVHPKSSNSVDMAASSSSTVYGYVKGVVTYMVMDNLEVEPMSTISALTLMNKFHVRDVASLVEKHVQVGFNERVKILKASLETRAVLTTVFLPSKAK